MRGKLKEIGGKIVRSTVGLVSTGSGQFRPFRPKRPGIETGIFFGEFYSELFHFRHVPARTEQN